MNPPVYRCPGTAVFLNATKETTPLALRANVEHTNTVHRNVLHRLHRHAKRPDVPEADQVVIDDLGYQNDGITHVTARLGFQDHTNVPRILRLPMERGLQGDLDLDNASYFLSRMTIVPTNDSGIVRIPAAVNPGCTARGQNKQNKQGEPGDF